MTRTAHLLIKEIHNDSNNVLEKVRVVLELDTKISNPNTPIELKKEDIIFLIEDGDTVKTVYKKSEDASWNIGAKVSVVNLGGKKYLRTDSNLIPSDNLDNLPKY